MGLSVPCSQHQHARCLYVLYLMASSWLGELLPIPVTSLLVVILFPILGIMTTAQVPLDQNLITAFSPILW